MEIFLNLFLQEFNVFELCLFGMLFHYYKISILIM